MKRKLHALLVLLLLGVAKLPLEEGVTDHLRAARLHSPPVDLGLRESFGQMGFAAALGGLRSLVASITYLQAYAEWENIQWAKVDSLFQVTTRLQPRYRNYWEEAAWHMAYNAASSYLNDTDLNPLVRGRLYHDHVRRGIDILNEGLRYLPEEPRLWNSLGEIYERRVHDPVKAAECYLRVFSLTKNPRYERFAGYQLAQATDAASWRRAYDLLKHAYDTGARQPSVIDVIKSLEQRLDIPARLRIPEAVPPMQTRQGATGPVR